MAWILDKLLGGVVDVTVAPIAFVAFTAASFLVYLAGMLLNLVTQVTVVDMAATLKGLGISEVWVTIRDLANMGFIFILLYASILTIIGKGQDMKKLIVNMVVVALLINFSLFFTKLIIDASNILAVTFYDAIAPGSLNSVNSGLSASMMKSLHLQTIFKDIVELNGLRTIIISVMGVVITLAAAFVFFAISIMLIVRFVILVMVMALSPLAFIGMIMPQVKDQTSQWWKALIGQAFFAPIYFMLTWLAISISYKMSGAIGAGGGSIGGALSGSVSASGTATADPTGVKMLLNYIIVLGFFISALMISKNWANKSGSGISKLTSWATSAAGGVAFGGLGAGGRNTLGWIGRKSSESTTLQEAAAKERTGKWDATKGAAARLALGVSKKARSGTFDARNFVLPGRAVGEAIEGTVGRTKFGKTFGLDDVNTFQNAEVGAQASGMMGTGKGQAGGKVERSEASQKRVSERDAAREAERNLVQAKANIKAGAASTASATQVDDMEKALAKLSDKQTEALVASNRELLDSQNFANKLSVQQLETLNKSDKFTESEKGKLINSRFAAINTGLAAHKTAVAAAVAGGATPPTMSRDLSSAIKALSDKELEMIDPQHLTDREFVGAMKSGQIDAVGKSNKFTSSQKDALRTARRQPMHDAMASNTSATVQTLGKKMNYKELAGLMSVPGPNGVNMALDNNILRIYTPQLLRRMSEEMSPEDIAKLGQAIVTGGTGGNTFSDPATVTWLQDPDKGKQEFPWP